MTLATSRRPCRGVADAAEASPAARLTGGGGGGRAAASMLKWDADVIKAVSHTCFRCCFFFFFFK